MNINNIEDKNFIHDKNISLHLRFLIKIAMQFISAWYSFLLLIARKGINKTNNKYYFSICAIFKDESLVLKEWIEYHKIIGVQHFYLFNNQSSDNYYEILHPFIEEGLVTIIDWDINPPCQTSAYEYFYRNFRKETKWIAFIDLDEYLCPKRENDIKEWIKKYDNYHAIVVYWKPFGASGMLKHDTSKLLIEQYYLCWDKFYDIGKTIFNTNYDVFAFSVKYIHEMPAKVNCLGKTFLLPPINEFKKFINYKCNRIGFRKSKEDFTIQLNHYVTKSYEDFFIHKRKRGLVSSTGKRAEHVRSAEAFDFFQKYSVTCDHYIQRFLIKLKIKMNNKDLD